MFQKLQLRWFAAIVVLVLSAAAAQAVTIDTVPVGNLGNAGEWSGVSYGGYGPDAIVGAVDYAYNIGRYEVTAGQYAEFLNAVAATDTYGLYNTSMDSDSFGCQITQNGSSGSYYYDFSGRPSGNESDWTNRPVNYISWGDAARFANWLHNGQGNGDTEDGAYNLSGTHPYYNPDGSVNDWDGLDATLMAVNREADWTWVIPSEDEWYKAAYHKNDGDTSNYFDYPTKSDDPNVPSNILDLGGNNATFYASGYTIGSPYWRTEVGAHENSESPYDTFDQGGNVWEWNEAEIYAGSTWRRGLRGGYWADSSSGPPYGLAASARYNYLPQNEYYSVGFRVASVPEPGSTTLLLCGLVSIICWRRRL